MTSDFWLNKLRNSGGAAPAPQPQGGLTPSGAPWWAHPTYTPPAPAPVTPVPPAQQEYTTLKAASAQQSGSCPNCQSEHFWRPTPNSAARCWNCNYNDRAMNSTQGLSVANNTSAPTRASIHQVMGSGYNPKPFAHI